MLSVGLIGCLIGQASFVAVPETATSQRPDLVAPAPKTYERLPVTPGLGSRLAAQLRRSAGRGELAVLVKGVPRVELEQLDAVVTAELGPITAARIPAKNVLKLADRAVFVDAPSPLRPALDVSRQSVHVPAADFGEAFSSKVRGRGVLVGLYDTGVDLSHPDLRVVDGPSRVTALWDQSAAGSGPVGFGFGNLCAPATETCAHRDAMGHGTSVAAIAASGGPKYRGVAPEADLLVASSNDFLGFVEALAWFKREAEERQQPLVVNISLVGHEGPHDGTSLQAQAIDALGHLVVVAAGNEGSTAVHTQVQLEGERKLAVLRFPLLPQAINRRAVIDIWGDAGLPLGVRGVLVNSEGIIVAQTSSVSVGQAGRTESLLIDGTPIGEVDLDPEAEANPENGQDHIRVSTRLLNWTDNPTYFAVEFVGEGRIDAWVDTPASEPAVVRFATSANTINSEALVLGDTDSTVGDPATAATALSVGAYISRTTYESLDGPVDLGGTVGNIASFTSRGPTLAPENTGAKPEITAPGSVVVAALSSATVLSGSERVDTLYRAIAGTSMAAPHVAGAAALLLEARPAATREELKSALLSAAAPVESSDSRFGVGKLDVQQSLSYWAESGSGCRSTRPTHFGLLVLLVFLIRRRRA